MLNWNLKKALQDDLKEGISKKIVESEAKELREPLWEHRLRQGLDVFGKTDTDLLSERKGADWKVMLAGYMRKRCLTPNAWLAKRLNMGTAKPVSSRISQFRKDGCVRNSQWEMLGPRPRPAAVKCYSDGDKNSDCKWGLFI